MQRTKFISFDWATKYMSIVFVLLFIGVAADVRAMGREKIARRILDYYAKVPGERLYIQTDRTCYMPGDTLWMRLHVADAATGLPVSRSQFVYVELYELQRDTLVQRIMVKNDGSGVFASAMLIPRKAATGIYTLAAYTRWMQNFNTADFAYRHISIGGNATATNANLPTAVTGQQTIEVAQRKGQLLIKMRHGH